MNTGIIVGNNWLVRKLVSILLIVCMLFSYGSLGHAAEAENVTLNIEDGLSGSPGDNVSMAVYMDLDETAGFNGYALSVSYDSSELKLTDVRNNQGFDEDDDEFLWLEMTTDEIIITADGSAMEDGLLLTLEFKIKDGATDSTTVKVAGQLFGSKVIEDTPIDTVGSVEATGFVTIIANAAPTASDVSISGTAQVGQTLTGSYTYSDEESNAEDVSTFQWYTADDSSGTNKTAIDGAASDTFTLTSEQVGKYILFEVTPVATEGTITGDAAISEGAGPVEDEPETYTVTFNSKGGNEVESITDVNSGDKIAAPPAPTKADYQFEGWYKDEDFTAKWDFSADTVTEKNLILFAKWTRNTVGIEIGSASGAPGTIVTVPVTVTSATYGIGSYQLWMDYDASALEVTGITGNSGDDFDSNYDNTNGWLRTAWADSDGGETPVKASDKLFTVSFKIKKTATEGVYGLRVETEDPNHFSVTDADAVEMEKTLKAGDVTVTEKPETYTVTFDSMGGSEVASVTDVTDSSTIDAPANPTRKGYTFLGWYTDEAHTNKWDFSTDTVTSYTTLYAKWKYSDSSTGGNTTTTHNVKLVLTSNPDQEGNAAKVEITKNVGQELKLSAQLLTADGKPLHIPELEIGSNGGFSLPDIPAGEYKVILSVVAPTGEKLAGRIGKLTVDANGNAKLEADLIDPYGLVTDAVTGAKIEGARTTLYWSDTELNRSNGRGAGEAVTLPELPNFAPNQNHNPQESNAEGQYGWMVFPDGDYYIIVEKDGYETYDSRKDTRDEQQGTDSYIRQGNIHVGQSIVKYDIQMQPKVIESGEHQPYMQGYPDGEFKPERGITRAELAMILSRTMAAQTDAATATASYADVDKSHWAAEAIELAFEKNWMTGYGNGYFEPKKQVTRAELAQVLMNVKQWNAGTNNPFPDVTGYWAEAAIAAGSEHGLLSGYPDGRFHPDAPITRSETIVVFNKLLDRHPWQIKVESKWPDVPASYWNYDAIMEASILHVYEKFMNGTENWKQ